MRRKIIVGITGATGSIYALRLLKILSSLNDIEVHLIVSSSGVLTLRNELDLKINELYSLVSVVHNVKNIGDVLASGSFSTDGMLIVPCSIRTLSAIANGLSDNLIVRAADVSLKERRRIVLMVRESPFNLVHLRNMISVTEMGGIIFPPMPAFYHKPVSIEEMVDHTVIHAIKLLNIDIPGPVWKGI
ncbi:UbiX family flavin prenyltransferase [Candidatus Kinetoplastidibacterium galati]|uniref:Flavin prenyltransferase UbiX n=1 Tax=Candidatus Kinetoplastidibacterium galati TCC219 TaxID=1208921 RepID=M1L8A0_9PROT|nr:UbiX family flavin prenyltransferase [Candidatus Kinetoplastibacterium galatii]AGF48798.1 3-octaprenyl-4-hydroxybenzoate carboxy-lyase UbiX [Candidatus Kinetoplastibacterium galatii TCC219]